LFTAKQSVGCTNQLTPFNASSNLNKETSIYFRLLHNSVIIVIILTNDNGYVADAARYIVLRACCAASSVRWARTDGTSNHFRLAGRVGERNEASYCFVDNRNSKNFTSLNRNIVKYAIQTENITKD